MGKGKRKGPKRPKGMHTVSFGHYTGSGAWSGNTQGTVHHDKRVILTNDKGDRLRDIPSMGFSTDFTSLGNRSGGVTLKDKVDYVTLTEEQAKPFLTTIDLNAKKYKPKPLMCTYDATKAYCEAILGIKFSVEDSEFFESHPLVQSDGVPFPDTLRVVQELIDPYHLRISRVQMMPNYSVKGDIRQWRKVLGVNPLALGDKITTNVEFATQTGTDTSQYRFEHTPEALFPAIACGVMYSDSQVATGTGGGHATYVPPRRRAHGAMLSFQIDHADRVQWNALPTFETLSAEGAKLIEVFDLEKWYDKYVRGTGSNSHSWGKVKSSVPKITGGGGGESLVDRVVNAAVDSLVNVMGGGETGEKEVPVPNATTNEHGLIIMDGDKPACFRCKRLNKQRTHTLGVPGLCDACWDVVCSAATCPEPGCRSRRAGGNNVWPAFRFVKLYWQTQQIWCQCTTCSKVFWLDRSFGVKITTAMQALQTYRLQQEQIQKETRLFAKVKEGAAVEEKPITREELEEAYGAKLEDLAPYLDQLSVPLVDQEAIKRLLSDGVHDSQPFD